MIIPLISEKKLREEIIGVSAVTWWNYRRSGKLDTLKYVVIGARRFFRAVDVEEWINEMILMK